MQADRRYQFLQSEQLATRRKDRDALRPNPFHQQLTKLSVTQSRRERPMSIAATILAALRIVLHDVVVNGIMASGAIPSEIRWLCYRAVGMNVARSRICSRCFFGTGELSIGRRSFINHGVFIDTSANVTLEENVGLGMQVTIVTSAHELGDSLGRVGAFTPAPVTIGTGSWIGANTTILPGVTIGQGCVVAAGSVVATDCAPNGLYAGVPAVRKRDLPESAD